MQFHPEVAQLADLMSRIEEILTRHGETHWSTMIRNCRVSVEKSDAWGLNGFLALFGGMGSINDLVLQRDGRMLVDENDELHELLGRAAPLGKKLQREHLRVRAN